MEEVKLLMQVSFYEYMIISSGADNMRAEYYQHIKSVDLFLVLESSSPRIVDIWAEDGTVEAFI